MCVQRNLLTAALLINSLTPALTFKGVMEIIELKHGELTLCKKLRLNALKDAPGAFSESYTEAAGQPIEYWQRIFESLIPPNKNRMFIAKDSIVYCGSVYALLDTNDSSTGRLGGMWVDSNFRKAGIGAALFNALKIWAAVLKLSQIRLWAEDIDAGAKEFYLGLGFEETGVKDLSRSKIDKNLCEMMFKLGA